MVSQRELWAARASLPGGSESAAVSRALAYIDANFEQPVRVADLAAVAGLSRHHSSRVFSAAVGTSPHDYLLETRVLRARALIEDSRLPLVDIALQTGFSSQAHMTDIFRRQLGVSPARLRKR